MEMVWIIALELGTINALSQLSRLQTLHLDTEFSSLQSFLDYSSLSSSMRCYQIRVVPTVSPLFLFSNVTFSLTQSFQYQGMGDVSMDKNQVKAVFFLAAIEIIEAVVFQQRIFNWPTPILPLASKLKTLKLTHCRLDENGLRRILSVTPSLEYSPTIGGAILILLGITQQARCLL